MGKYAEYFKGNELLTIPEILQKLESRIVSLVVTDHKTRRLVGLKKESFEELLRKASVPCQYFCCRSFAIWDALQPSKEQAAKVASNNIVTKFFRLQPEYLGTRRIRLTVCNVPAFITGEVRAAFLSAYGCVEEINLLRSAAETAYGDYAFRLCLTREGFQANPKVIVSRERQMMVAAEGRRLRCWGCKQLGHIAKFCSKKDQHNAAATKITTVTTATISSEQPTKATAEKDPGPVQSKTSDQPKADEGWTEVTRKKENLQRKEKQACVCLSCQEPRTGSHTTFHKRTHASNTNSSNSIISSNSTSSRNQGFGQKETKKDNLGNTHGHHDESKEEERQWRRGLQKDLFWAISS